MNERELEKDLRAICGERATVSRHERWFYQRDLVDMPRWATRLVKTMPEAVVAPANTAEVSAVLRYCNYNRIAVTARGAGSSGLYGAVPKRGGIVLDLRGLSCPVEIDHHNQAVRRLGAGMTWWELDRVLSGHGLTLMTYPSSARSATIGGWLMTTGMGIGNIKYGPVHDQVLSAEVVLADGTVAEHTRSDDLEVFLGSEGLLGIVTQVSLKARPVPPSTSHHLAYFPRIADMFEFILAQTRTAPLPYAVEFFDNSYLRLLRTGGYPTIDFGEGSGLALITYDGSRDEVDEGRRELGKQIAACHGEEREGAEEEWRQRFNMLRVRRAVRSLVPSSVEIPMSGLMRFSEGVGRMRKRPLGLLGHVVSKDDCVLMAMMASDEDHGLDYTLALHTPPRISNLAISLGGKPAGGLGLWNSAYRSSERIRKKAQKIRARKADIDPKSILNPGMWTDPPLLLKPAVFRAAISLASVADRLLPLRSPGSPVERPDREFTDCVQCGYCMGYCPTKQQWLSSTPRGRVLAVRNRLIPEIKAGRTLDQDVIDDVFECTLCGRCRTDCSVSVKSPEMWTDIRGDLVGARGGVESLRTLSGSIEQAHNLAGKPNEQRSRWADALKLAHHKDKAETVYFVGCVTSFYPMVQDVARSFARILDRVETDFAIMGGEEWCCGYPLISAGYRDSAIRHMEHNIQRAQMMGAKRILTTCPGCYRMWAHDYARTSGRAVPFEVQHSSEFLAGLVEREQVDLGEIKASVTYHDPCDLGRNAGIYGPPRYVINHIPGLEFTELGSNHEYTNCCGSGGDLLASNQSLSLDVGGRKVKEIMETGASTVVTACPSCIRGITMAKLAAKAPLAVMDLSQLVWKSMAATPVFNADKEETR